MIEHQPSGNKLTYEQRLVKRLFALEQKPVKTLTDELRILDLTLQVERLNNAQVGILFALAEIYSDTNFS